jgi:hypothetical protein
VLAIFIHALVMAINAWRYSGTIVFCKSALHSLTRRLHSAMVSSGVDEVVIKASLVSMYYRQIPAFTAIAIPNMPATGIFSLIFISLLWMERKSFDAPE